MSFFGNEFEQNVYKKTIKYYNHIILMIIVIIIWNMFPMQKCSILYAILVLPDDTHTLSTVRVRYVIQTHRYAFLT